jgi:MYXO-CTERM domain-containing protein
LLPLPLLATGASMLVSSAAFAQSVAVDTTQRAQTIDGFGTCLSSSEPMQSWWQNLYFDDLAASMVRVDITPTFKAPYDDESYCSPWYGQAAPLTLDNGGNGPDGSRTRQYTGAADYATSFGGCSAPIAVMGTDIDTNAALFDFTQKAVPGLVAQLGAAKASQLGGFKLYASMWSPAPWVKVSSGNTYSGGASPLPTAVPWPFIWGGNFAGGKLDVSGTPLSQFDDGTGPTSALTQFARGLAAFLYGFQKAYGVSFYGVSIQNELNFEEYYNSATYPLASEYLTALKAARAELDSHPELSAIRIVGPEDLMGGDAYSMWQYGSGASETDKNLQYLQAIAADGAAASAIAGFAIHGYATDGVSSAGASPQSWDWWTNGWTTSPAGGIPANVSGFKSFGKPSWMTETSGEKPEWLAASTSGGFPDSGGFSIAVKIQQALTTGSESAWLYWQLTDGSASDDSHVETLTDSTQLANDPKYVAAKHFFKYIRPGAQRVAATVTGSTNVLASAFVNDATAQLTMVLVNEGSASASVAVTLASPPAGLGVLSTYTSSNGNLWVSGTASLTSGALSLVVPAYGVLTVTGTGTPPVGLDGGGDTEEDGGGGMVIGGSEGGAVGDGGSLSVDGSPPGSQVPGVDGAVVNGDGGAEVPASPSGCGCLAAGEGHTTGAGWVALVAAGAALGRRRRRG